MNHFQSIRIQIRAYLIFVIMIENLLIILGLWIASAHLHVNLGLAALGAYAVSIVMTFIITFAAADFALAPLKAVWLNILHILPGEHGVSTPDISKLSIGRPLVMNLSAQIYQIASEADHVGAETQEGNKISSMRSSFIANALPLPLLLLDDKQNVVFANEAATKYLNLLPADILGKEVYSVLDMSFPSDQTFDKWYQEVKAKNVTANGSWERVRLNPVEGRPRQLFDLAAYYNKDNPSHIETMLVMFDHTKQYSQDDQAVSFIALTVHELRTPLTLLRGYIEAFEEEFAGRLSPEMNDFMFKMSATAQQLTAFVNNILNVARVDDDQLVLQLHEEDWGPIVRQAANRLALRAKVRGITVEYSIASDLPAVGVDRVSIIEVINNLVDNAIKYSGKSHKIRISAALNSEGMVETTVQDFGVGIPANIMPNLFTKFYRDHHNRAQIGGTGLGLYLSKAIVDAHGGSIWVKSKVGEGSIFGFTLIPYAKLADEVKNSDNKEIVRGAHGWIKNHSLYRR